MKKNTIVHFVGFVTSLKPDEFVPGWEQFAKRFMSKKKGSTFQQHITARKNKLSYLSRHEWDEPGFDFSFMNGRRSAHFPEHNVRVVQLGGYQLKGSSFAEPLRESDTKIVSFINHAEPDLSFYRQLPCRHLRINQAYYENCLYGYILEFFVDESGVEQLLEQLGQREKAETGVYRESILLPA
jgi:hypothetical protein